jgi:hypothetical protein
VRKARSYGASYLLLRNVRLRTTFAAKDSGGINIEDLATVDYYAHVLEKYSDKELEATVQVATGQVFGRDSEVIMNYKEAQIHGDVRLAENVELIMVHPSMRGDRHADMLQKLSACCKAPIVWMEGTDGEDVGEDADDADDSCEDSIDRSPIPPTPTTVSHDGFDDKELLKAIEASRASALELAIPEASSAPIDGFDENDLLKAIEASRESANEEKLALEATEASEFELAIELSNGVHEDTSSSLCMTCSNGCGRARADGYNTCCRTCTESGGKRHGPTCDESFAIKASMASTCRNGWCCRPTIEGSVLCARCKEEEDMIEQAIKASMEVRALTCRNGCSTPVVDGSELCRQCMEQEELERAIQASTDIDATDDMKCVDDEVLTHNDDSCEASKDAATILTESLGVESSDGTRGEVLGEPTQTTHVLKAKLHDDTRRLQVVWCTSATTAEMLQAISEGVRLVFGLNSSEELVLTYKDDYDGDMLTLVETTVEDFLASQSGTLRIFVKIVEDTNAQSLCDVDVEVTAGASCDGAKEEETLEVNEDDEAKPEHGSIVQESGMDLDAPKEGNTTNDDQEHFIGHDLSNWDDFEHVADPLEEWYDNPEVVVVTATHCENPVCDGQEDEKAELS